VEFLERLLPDVFLDPLPVVGDQQDPVPAAVRAGLDVLVGVPLLLFLGPRRSRWPCQAIPGSTSCRENAAMSTSNNSPAFTHSRTGS
jgi:hypothetical protein